VREVIFAGLSDPIRKIRLACVSTLDLAFLHVEETLTCILRQANIVSSVAQPDWPDDWPTLMDQLLVLVRSSSIDAVEGGMRALSDFISISITEDQLLPIRRKGKERRERSLAPNFYYIIYPLELTIPYIEYLLHCHRDTFASSLL